MSNLRELTEARGKLIEQLRLAVKAKDYSQEKVDKINADIDRKTAEIDLLNLEDGKAVKELKAIGEEDVYDIRDYETRKPIKKGSPADLEQYVSDIVKSAFGLGSIHNRDVLEGSGSGQYIVPAVLSGTMVSYIIERSLLGRLGVHNVTVSTDTTSYAQVSALPTADVIAEGGEVTETSPTFVSRTLQMYSFRAGTIISQEFEEDSVAHPQNIIEPLGLDNMTGTYMRLHLGANGAALTGFEELEALWRKAREPNHNVSAFVMAPRTLGEYKLLEDANEAPKANPFAEIPMVETNQVGIADTQGTSSNASKIFARNFKKSVWAGWCYGGPDRLKFIVDRNTLAEFGKVRIYAYVRMGLANPYGTGVFGYVKGVIPASGAIT